MIYVKVGDPLANAALRSAENLKYTRSLWFSLAAGSLLMTAIVFVQLWRQTPRCGCMWCKVPHLLRHSARRQPNMARILIDPR